MEYLITHITGLDMALCLALLLAYFRLSAGDDQTGGLDTGAAD